MVKGDVIHYAMEAILILINNYLGASVVLIMFIVTEKLEKLNSSSVMEVIIKQNYISSTFLQFQIYLVDTSVIAYLIKNGPHNNFCCKAHLRLVMSLTGNYSVLKLSTIFSS